MTSLPLKCQVDAAFPSYDFIFLRHWAIPIDYRLSWDSNYQKPGCPGARGGSADLRSAELSRTDDISGLLNRHILVEPAFTLGPAFLITIT